MTASSDCVFCKIVSGDIRAVTILDTEHAYAFLDIAPLAEGHTLLIPRDHVESLEQMPPEGLARLMRELPRLARTVASATGAEGLNILQNNGRVAGQVVDHVHFHIIPRRSGDGLGYRWNAGAYPEGRAEALQAQIREALHREALH